MEVKLFVDVDTNIQFFISWTYGLISLTGHIEVILCDFRLPAISFCLLTPCPTQLNSLNVCPVWPALFLVIALFMDQLDQLSLVLSLNFLVSGAILAF